MRQIHNRRGFLKWCCCAAAMPVGVGCDKPHEERSKEFLVRALQEEKLGLACHVRGTQQPAPVHNEGWVFSSHFAVLALGGELPAATSTALRQRLLESRRSDAWSYGVRAPVDSDDTAFALRTLRVLGAAESRECLDQFYVQEKNAYKTFLWESTKRLELNATVAANTGIHAEVNLNIAELCGAERGGRPQLEPMLEQCIGDDGEVRSYFYPCRWYGSYWLLAAQRAGVPIAANWTRKALEFVRGSQGSDGSWDQGDPYASALALATLRMGGEYPDAQASAERFLREAQRPDGSWATKAVIWEYVLAPEIVWDAFDSNRVVCTSLARIALRERPNV